MDISIRALNSQKSALSWEKKRTAIEQGCIEKYKRYPATDENNRRTFAGTMIPVIFSSFGSLCKPAYDHFTKKVLDAKGQTKLARFFKVVSFSFARAMAFGQSSCSLARVRRSKTHSRHRVPTFSHKTKTSNSAKPRSSTMHLHLCWSRRLSSARKAAS